MRLAYRPVRFPERAFSVAHRTDGSIVVESRLPPDGPFQPVTDRIDLWAEVRPDLLAFAERGPDDVWRGQTWRELATAMRSVGEALLGLELGPERPLMLATANSVDGLLLTFAALHVGIPLVPVSPTTFAPGCSAERAKGILALVRPGLVIVSPGDDAALAGGLGAAVMADGGADLVTMSRLERPSGLADQAHAALRPDTMAKVLFTSGSAGSPKAVPQTQGMLETARHMTSVTGSPIEDGPPAYMEWMPWHHVMGGNIALHRNLTFGGTFYIDAGKPIPGRFETTLRNLREISPSSYTSAPVGYAMLIAALERDHDLARSFFKRLWCMVYGGAALAPDVFDRFNTLTEKLLGERIAFCAGYGTTESCGPGLSQYWPAEVPDLLGLPLSGLSAKIAPVGERFELRLKGGNIFAGYVADADADARFDEEGFYRTGDAVLVDPSDIGSGIRFNGRLSENFKLSSGTWVDVGALRLKLLDTLAPLILDAVICGENRQDVRALVWPRPAAIAAFLGRDDWADDAASCVRLEAALGERLAAFTSARGSSSTVTALLILSTPPSAREGEVNDKGYINQRRCLETRAGDVATLYATDTAKTVAWRPPFAASTRSAP